MSERAVEKAQRSVALAHVVLLYPLTHIPLVGAIAYVALLAHLVLQVGDVGPRKTLRTHGSLKLNLLKNIYRSLGEKMTLKDVFVLV